MDDQSEQHDLFFIRHGQSLKNQAAHHYQHQRNLPFDWELFVKDPVFVQTVTHNPKYIDCHLSQKGVQQCKQAHEYLKSFKPDLIICSPLQRALETARIIFPHAECPRIVEPLISETFKHSSEICRSIQTKKNEFPEFNFQRVEAEGQFWFIKNDSPQNQQRYFECLKEVEEEEYLAKVEKINDFMRENKMREYPSNVRERSRKVKKLLKQYRKTYNKIAVVSHFYTIRFLLCKEFDKNDEPVADSRLNTGNCGCLYASLQEIEKYD